MQFLHPILRRPRVLLTVAVALTAMLTVTACGSAAQPETADAATAGGDNDSRGAQPNQSDHHSQTDTDSSASGGHHAAGGESEETSHGQDNDGTQSNAVPGDARIIDMDISARTSELSRESLQVKRGDTVSFNFTADEPGEVHLHGYNLSAAVSPESPGTLTFVAETAGSFGLNFHVFAPMNVRTTGGSNPHDAMTHQTLVSEVPIGMDFTADVESDGSVSVHITTEGWRWAPEEVNQEHTPGAGHAHIYVDGEKITRVYGPDYHLTGLEPGEREIRVNLNSNQHSELLVEGQLVEKTVTLTIPDTDGVPAFPATLKPAHEFMSVEIVAHADSLGGYNLQLITSGFAFAPGQVHQAHVDGEGYGHLFIDGEYRSRIYGAWVQVPSLAPGDHEISVTLVSNDGIAYSWNDQQVAATITVNEPEQDADPGHSSHGSDHGDGHSHGAASEREVIAEVHLGNLEVYP